MTNGQNKKKIPNARRVKVVKRVSRKRLTDFRHSKVWMVEAQVVRLSEPTVSALPVQVLQVRESLAVELALQAKARLALCRPQGPCHQLALCRQATSRR